MGSLALKTDYKIICRFGSDPFYIMTGRQNKELLAEVNEALGQIAEAGASFQTDLYQKYYGEKEAEGEVVFTREEAEYIQGSGVITVAFIASRARCPTGTRKEMSTVLQLTFWICCQSAAV